MPQNEDPKDIVRRAYDYISYIYRPDQEDAACLAYHSWLDELLPLLAPGSDILELGCGCGIPVAVRLADNYNYTGVDLSPVQIERASRNAPRGRFLCADMTTVNFQPASLDAVLAFYSIIHVPVVEQPGLLQRITGWLKPGGLFLATLGFAAWTGTEENWLNGGATMYWSHADQHTYLDWLSGFGLQVQWTRFIPEGSGGHLLVMAVRPAA